MDNIKQKAKELVLESPARGMVSLEKIEEIFSNVIICDTKEELMTEYNKYKGTLDYISGFTHGDKIYIGPEQDEGRLIHNIVHEALHRMSKRWDKEGKLMQNGIQCRKGQRFSEFLNEGVTDYLAKKIVGGNYCQYHGEANVIEGLDKEMVRYFEDENILFSMYLQDDNTGLENERFKEFLETTKGKGAYDDLYENISFMNKEKTEKYMSVVHKGVNKSLRKRKIQKTLNGIKTIFTKREDTKLLNKEQTKDEKYYSNKNDITSILHEKINEEYKEIPCRQNQGIDEPQLIRKETKWEKKK